MATDRGLECILAPLTLLFSPPSPENANRAVKAQASLRNGFAGCHQRRRCHRTSGRQVVRWRYRLVREPVFFSVVRQIGTARMSAPLGGRVMTSETGVSRCNWRRSDSIKRAPRAKVPLSIGARSERAKQSATALRAPSLVGPVPVVFRLHFIRASRDSHSPRRIDAALPAPSRRRKSPGPPSESRRPR